MCKPTLTFILIIVIGFMTDDALATHISGGEIIARRVNNVSLTYEITVIGYRNLDSTIEFAGGVLRMGDGAVINGPFSTTVEQIDNQIERVYFTVMHTFKGPSAAGYLISYQEDFRNDYIANIDNGNSVQTTFYIETKLVIDPFLGSNDTPVLVNPPVVWGQAGKIYQANPGAYDPDGDLLTYRIVDIKRAENTPVSGYRSPVYQDFYSNYEQGNAAGNAPPTFTIDRFSGLLTWDAPGDIGYADPDCNRGTTYDIAIAVEEWRNVRGIWHKLGYVVRDYIIKIDHCEENKVPVLPSLADTCLVVGEQINRQIVAANPDGDPITYRADGEPFLLQKAAEYSASEASLEFDWAPTCKEVRTEPYIIYFRATDRISSGPALASVSSLSINVIGPEVEGIIIQDEAPGMISLSWDSYTCPNADSMEIWRKEGEFSGERCELIKPGEHEFQLAGKVPINQLDFTDNSLPAGTNSNDFTYHLMATFPGNANDDEELYDVLTGLNDSGREHRIRIFPNPTTGSVKIDPVKPGWQYKLYDISGRFLQKRSIDATGAIHQFSSHGFYIIVIEDQNEREIHRSRLIIRP